MSSVEILECPRPEGRGRRLPIVAAVALVALGCSSTPERARPGLEAIPLGRQLEAMWSAHGGLDAWRAHERGGAVMTVRGDPPNLALPSQRIRFRLDDWQLLRVGEDEAEDVLDLREGPPADRATDEALTLDYHLKSARFLFHLPFAIAGPGWELRQDFFSGSGLDALPDLAGQEVTGFWAIPVDSPTPHVGYYLVPDPESGLLRTFFYQVKHPRFRGKIFRADIRRYERVAGVLFATEIVHALVRPRPRTPADIPPVDPFEPVRAVFDPAAPAVTPDRRAFPDFWQLKYENITLE